MPLRNSLTVVPSSLISSNSPSVGQIPAVNSDGSFTYVDNEGGSAELQLTEFIANTTTRGFTDNSQSSLYLSGDELDVVNLDDAGDGIDFYLNGTLYHITGNRSIALTGGEGNAHTTGLYYIYADTSDLTLKVKTSLFNFNGAEILIAAIGWNGSLASGKRSLISDERHTCEISSRLHSYLHFTEGMKVSGGGQNLISGFVLGSGATNAQKQFDIAQCDVYDEDLKFTLDELVGGNSKYSLYFRTGVGEWGWLHDQNFPLRIADSVSARVCYDDGTLAGAEADSGTYFNLYVLLTNIEGQARHLCMTSQETYATFEEAHSVSFADLDLSGISLPEKIVIGKFTVGVADSVSGTGHFYYEDYADYQIPSGDLSPSALGVPSLVQDSIANHFVSFVDENGVQKDSGYGISDVQLRSEKGQASGYVALDASSNINLGGGGLKSTNVITAIKLGDASNTSLNSANKTLVGSINETYDALSYLSSGVFGDPPTIEDLNNGSATFGEVDVLLYPNSDFTGTLTKHTVSSGTFSFTDGAEEFVCVKYNNGSPVMYKETNLSNINYSSVIILFVCWRVGTTIHSLNFDSAGNGLSSKLQMMEYRTQLYRLHRDGGMVLAETTSPNPRTITVSSGIVYAGGMPYQVSDFNSSTDTMTFVRNVSGDWTYSTTLVYNNTQYDDGTDLFSLGSGKYGVVWFYRSIGDVKQTFYVLGTQAYDTSALASLSQPRADLPLVLLRHCMLVGRAIVLSGATSGNTESSLSVSFTSYAPISHNDTTGIQGAGNYHISSAEATKVTALGTISSQASNNVSITGGSISGITDLAVLDGGTGASTPANARTNLGAANVAGDTFTGKIVTFTPAAVAGAGLNLPAGIVPNSPANGDILNSSVQNSLAMYIGGIREDFTGVLFTKIDNTAVTASTTTNETSVLGTGVGTTILPANFLTAGKSFRIKFGGFFTTSGNSATLTFARIKFGATTICNTTVINPDNNLSSVEFYGQIDLTCRAVGAGTTSLMGQGYIDRAISTTAITVDPILMTTPVATLDSTVQNTLDVVCQYSQNTAGNSITYTNITVEVLK